MLVHALALSLVFFDSFPLFLLDKYKNAYTFLFFQLLLACCCWPPRLFFLFRFLFVQQQQTGQMIPAIRITTVTIESRPSWPAQKQTKARYRTSREREKTKIAGRLCWIDSISNRK
jgi:hypothetical protein